MEISIWNYSDYKKYLRARSRALNLRRGFLSRLADAAGCQPSYLSQVLNSKVQLTPDQACSIASHLELSENEATYFLALVDLARAGSPLLKQRLSKQIFDLKTRAQKISERLQRPASQIADDQIVYYSSWTYSALHILSSTREFQTVDALSERLNIDREHVLNQLKQLESMGLVINEAGRWRHSGEELHLPATSPLISMHHANWRSRALMKAQANIADQHSLPAQRLSAQGLHFSGVYAISREDVQTIREILLRAIEAANKVVGPSASEELVALTCDFFIV
jgi:uncharacterized protein (TIGR02147 family)